MKLSYLFFCVFLLFACKSSRTDTAEQGGLIKHAANFQLISMKNYQLLQLFHPKTHKLEASFALVKRGEHPDVPSNTSVIAVPVKKIAALSSTFIGMLNELNALETVAITTSEKYLWNKKIKTRIRNGSCSAVASDDAISPELLIKRKVELIVFSGFGQPFPNESKLNQLGIATLPNYDWEETTALGKLEWIKLFGALTGKLDLATNYFNKITNEYNHLKVASRHLKGSNKRVLVGDFYGDNWIAPAGDSYIARILKDAGINYLYQNKNGTASIQLSPEQVIKDEKSCVIWINAEGTSLLQLIKNDVKRKQLTVLKHQQVYSYLHDSNYFWEMSAVHPEWLLFDFCQIAQNKKTPMHFYQRLAE
jgi:iron complex transport system substrate-binding protein